MDLAAFIDISQNGRLKVHVPFTNQTSGEENTEFRLYQLAHFADSGVTLVENTEELEEMAR